LFCGVVDGLSSFPLPLFIRAPEACRVLFRPPVDVRDAGFEPAKTMLKTVVKVKLYLKLFPMGSSAAERLFATANVHS
jgi:hypothetical protein